MGNLSQSHRGTPQEVALLDPVGEYPATSNPERLFNPAISIQLGAIEDAKAAVVDELGAPLDYEETCPEQQTQCTWERLWKRRFRVYNTGKQGVTPAGTDYTQKVFNKVLEFPPQP